jgi:hypothetical protein
MSPLIKKLIIIFSAVVFVLFIALVIGAWHLGAFAKVTVTQTERPALYYICRAERVPYAQIPAQLEELRALLPAGAHNYKESGALIYSDPAATPLNEIESQAVILSADSLSLPAPLLVGKLPAGAVLSASIHANPAIAVFKIYPALADWLAKNRPGTRLQYPLLEIYDPPLFTVRIPLQENR